MKCLTLIRSILDESERKGIGNLRSHSALAKGELLSLNVINEITNGTDVPKKIELKVYSNITVYDLRVEVAKLAKVTWDQVKLTRNLTYREIKDNENGRTLGDIRIKNGETFTGQKRPTPPIPQAPLILSDGTLNPLARGVFQEWFKTFSEDGKMSQNHLAAFIHTCTNDNCKGDDRRVNEIFAKWDTDKDGFLSEENFVEFYGLAAQERKVVVWNNLHAHHYRNDLKRVTDVEEEKIDITNLPRYIFTVNQKYFKLIFSLLGKTRTRYLWSNLFET